MAKIRVIADDLPTAEDQPHIYDLDPQGNFVDELVYMPHSGENFGNVGFLKLKLYCARRRIKLLAFGHLNQLPEFSVLSDKLILQTGDQRLSKLYHDKTTGLQVDKRLLDRATKARFIQGHRMSGAIHNYLLSRGQCDPRLGAELTDNILREHETIIAAMHEIDDQEVIDQFTWPDVCIRRSSWELFQQLDLPTDVICSEAKLGWGFADRIRDWLRRTGWSHLRGLDQQFQHQLLTRVGAHFMAVQFLASWFKNWTFICLGGSANLFALLPVKGLIMFDNWYKNTSTETCLRGLARGRYGSLGDEIPVFLPHDSPRPIEEFLDPRRAILEDAPRRLATIGYGGSQDSSHMIDFQSVPGQQR